MKNCPTCGTNIYGETLDCKRTSTGMLVDTCHSNRNGGGYCAHHPAMLSVDYGPVYHTRAKAAKAYACYVMGGHTGDVRARKIGACRYRVTIKK